jgi:hypothetical protein
MATLIESPFAQWQFTDEEAIQAAIFSTDQLHHIQNFKAECAANILDLQVTEDVITYASDKARLQGMIEACNYLMNTSMDSAEAYAAERGIY